MLLTLCSQVAALAIVIGLTLLFGTHMAGWWGTYNGQNKGMYVGHCGFEVVGDFGPFCGQD
jgi:hypothetical protein